MHEKIIPSEEKRPPVLVNHTGEEQSFTPCEKCRAELSEIYRRAIEEDVLERINLLGFQLCRECHEGVNQMLAKYGRVDYSIGVSFPREAELQDPGRCEDCQFSRFFVPVPGGGAGAPAGGSRGVCCQDERFKFTVGRGETCEKFRPKK